ncbi:MAG: hypothetical protein L0Z62_00315 [Gemmataceae bacterium]|nr:hypothetical protein [Gemmataceae bacterium]
MAHCGGLQRGRPARPRHGQRCVQLLLPQRARRRGLRAAGPGGRNVSGAGPGWGGALARLPRDGRLQRGRPARPGGHQYGH